MGSLGTASRPEMRQLLDVMDDLRRIVANIDQEEPIQIPQIAVVGNQSVGKSSLLELLSGFKLPIGTDIVTRCPIVLRIRNASDYQVEVNEKIIPYDDAEQIGQAISDAQDKLIKAEATSVNIGKDVCDKAVETRISGPDKRDLTLVDLPGIQYSNNALTDKIKRMILKYIESESTIILLIMQSTSDPTATEALQCARTVDPLQERTMCILTKPDEVPADDQAKQKSLLSLMEGTHSQLKFQNGVFMVKARGSHQTGLSIQQVREQEAHYFKEHRMFSKAFTRRKAGYESLLPAVEDISLRSMHAYLPKLMRQIELNIDVKNKELKDLDFEDDLSTPQAKSWAVSTMIMKIESEMADNMDDAYENGSSIIFEQFQKSVMAILQEEEKTLKADLEQFVIERNPLRPTGIADPRHFRKKLAKIVDRIEPAAKVMFNAVSAVIYNMLQGMIDEQGNKYNLRALFVDYTNKLFEEQKLAVLNKINELIKYQKITYLTDLEQFYGPDWGYLRTLGPNFTFRDHLREEERSHRLMGRARTSTVLDLDVVTDDQDSSSNFPKSLDRRLNNTGRASDMTGEADSVDSGPEGAGVSPGGSRASKGTRFTRDTVERLIESEDVPTNMGQNAKDIINEYDIMLNNYRKYAYLTGFSILSSSVKMVTQYMLYDFRTSFKMKMLESKEELCATVSHDTQQQQIHDKLKTEKDELQNCYKRLGEIQRALNKELH